MKIYDRLYDIVMYEDKYPLIAMQCEQVVEDIAIQFAEWLVYNYRMESNYAYKNQEGDIFDSKELFEIFKQEKGL